MMQQKTCKIRILNDIYVVLVGLSPSHHELLDKKFKKPVAGAFFSPMVKLGRWDGMFHFYHKTGKTYVYLLDQILPILRDLGYSLQIEDLRVDASQPSPIDVNIFAHIKHLDTGEPITLYDYQVDSVNEAIAYGNGIVLAATGAGKTLVCAAMCQAYGKIGIKTLTIVPNRDLITNTKRDYINCGLDTGEYSGGEKSLNHQHIVSTWQSLQKNPGLVAEFGMVLVDECHGAASKSLHDLLTKHGPDIPYRFGVTGTLPKDETATLQVKVALGEVRYEVTAKDLIDRGILATLNIDIVQLEENLEAEYAEYLDEYDKTPQLPSNKRKTYKQFKDEYLPDFDGEKTYLSGRDDRMMWIADLIIKNADKPKGNTLCLVNSIKAGRALSELIPNSYFVNGQDVKDPKKRQIVYDKFKDANNLVVVATTHIASTGLNIRRIFNFVMIDPGQSFIRTIQSIGRGLRKATDKQHVNIVDICSDLKYSRKHAGQRIKYYNEAGYPHKTRKVPYQ